MATTEARGTYTLDEAAELLGVGIRAVREAVRRGQIAAIRVGRRDLVLKGPLDRKLKGEAA